MQRYFSDIKIIHNGLVLMTLILCLSCKKQAGTNISITTQVKVMNAQGQDLLNAPIVYDKNNIAVAHVINGQPKYYSVANGNAEKAFHIGNSLGVNKLFIYPTENYNETTSIALVQFGTSTPDTIRCEYVKAEGSFVCTKIWVNDQLKFDDSNLTNDIERVITLIK